MTPSRTLCGLVLVASSLAAVAGPAQAALPSKATVSDKARDAPAAIDLTSVTYTVTRQRTTFRASVRDLTRGKGLVAFESWPLTSAWDRIAIRRVDGRTVAKVYFVDNDLEDSDKPVPTRTPCPGLEVTWRPRADTVSAVVPASCLRASRPDSRPFEMHTFTRLGDKRDTVRAVTLDYPS
jgi:hypothetical protein